MKDKIMAVQTRLYPLDYLRGICAFSIMIYHYLLWQGVVFNANDVLQRLGIYGVSIFYVLSGLTLYCVYQNQDFSVMNNIKRFFKKRIVRIFPLFIVATMVVFFATKSMDWLRFFLNITGLFSIIDWSGYLVVGGWSIGNELSFYLIFPIAMLCLNKNKVLFYGLWVMSLVFYIYFSSKIGQGTSFSAGNIWEVYTNPLNQVFLFLSGLFIAHELVSKTVNQYINVFLFLLSILVFVAFPLENITDLIRLKGRFILTLASFLIVISFFKLYYPLPRIIHTPFALLGEMSYSIYLLHSIVFQIIKKIMVFIPFLLPWIMPISIITTLLVSYFSYYYFEQYFMKKVK